jgi:hypothetical protein
MPIQCLFCQTELVVPEIFTLKNVYAKIPCCECGGLMLIEDGNVYDYLAATHNFSESL